MFFKSNTPTVVDYDKTKSELLRLGWLVEIYDVEANKSIYDITSIGYQYYFAICMELDYDRLFGGPKLAESQIRAFIDENIDLGGEGYLIDCIATKKMTPKAAEYLYVLIDLYGKEIIIKKQNIKASKSGAMNKLGKYSGMFMRGMQKVSEVAQEYNKNSTIATRNIRSKDKKSSSRRKTSTRKRRYRRLRRKRRF